MHHTGMIQVSRGRKIQGPVRGARVLLVVNRVLIFALLVGPIRAQTPAPRPEFEVASVKLNATGARGREIAALSGGRWSVRNFTLKIVLQVAFDVKDFQILGGPAWIASDGYDISAKTDSDASFEAMQPMIRSLLADRFKLMVHRETRELPIYDLRVAKAGLKLAAPKEESCVIRNPNSPPSPPGPGEKPVCGSVGMGRGAVNGTAISMPMLGYRPFGHSRLRSARPDRLRWDIRCPLAVHSR
jgi:hypothetical protein